MKDSLLEKSNAILKNLNFTIDSFYSLYEQLDDDSKDQKQDLLRAIILFSCSGIDSIVKQLVNDTLDYVIEHDEGAFNQFKKFTERKIRLKSDAELNATLLADLFTCENPKKTLIEILKKELTSSSLQSADELLKVGSYFNIETSSLEKDKSSREELKEIFIVRNQITHEMDVDMMAPEFKRRERTLDLTKKYSKHIIDLAKNFIDIVSYKLDDTSKIDEFEQIISL